MWNVAILALIPGLASLPAGEDAPAKGLRLAISATTERIPLPRTRAPIVLTVDGLARRLRLGLSKGDNVKAVAARIGAHVGMLCPHVEIKEGAVELRCRSGRIEAQITVEGQKGGKTGSYLDINELRGLPWRDGPDAPPAFHYDPWRIGLGQSCPGRTEVAQGECELKAGRALEAATHFRKALETSGRQMACVRLGDISVGIGDPLTGGGWYRRAGGFGIFGRIANGRLCELDGKCLGSTEEVLRTFDSTGMPEPLRAESAMRAARAEAYAGRLPSAAHIIAKQIRQHGAASMCREGGETLCRRILLAAMRLAGAPFGGFPVVPGHGVASTVKSPSRGAPSLEKAERDYLEELIETYLALPSWEKGPLAVDLAQAAAPLAGRLGASAFGGNLLASLAPEVPDAQLSDHLLLATETFLGGQNWARARLVAEYAGTRLGTKRLKDPRWVAVARLLSQRSEESEVPPAVRAAIEAELVETLSDLKSARAVMARAESVVGGAGDARRTGGVKPGNEGKPREMKAGVAKPRDARPTDARPQVPKPGAAKPEAPKPAAATPGAVTAANTEAKR